MTKLFFLLKAFSAKELIAFSTFLENPLNNQRSDVRSLLSFWSRHGAGFVKEEAFEVIYPGEIFNIKSWHLLTSRLLKLAEQFLISNELRQDEVLQKTLLVNAYRKKQIPAFFESAIRAATKKLDKKSIQNTDWLLQKLKMEYQYYDYISSHNRKERTNLQDVNDLLDQYYVSNKLRFACLALSRKTMNQETYDIRFLRDTLHKIEESPQLLNTASISVYYYCYKAITQKESEAWFSLLREVISTASEKFKPSEKRDITLLAINYAIKKLNTGDAFFRRETFELYRLGFSEGYLLEDKIIPEPMFHNVVSLAVKNQEYKWAEQFIISYQKYLKPVFREPLYRYSMGLLYYEQGDLEKSLQSLVLVDTKVSFVLLATKSLQVKIYVELKETDALENLLESFRVYLQRRKDLGYRKENYENLIGFVKRLLLIPFKEKAEEEKLKHDVKSAKVFSEKEWLLKQLRDDR